MMLRQDAARRDPSREGRSLEAREELSLSCKRHKKGPKEGRPSDAGEAGAQTAG